MPKSKHPRIPASSGTELQDAVLEFLRRGQRAQAEVDRILTAEPERRRLRRQRGHA